jgi:hypothetical protein
VLVLVCGSRSFTNAQRIQDRLIEFPRGTRFVSGGARGADRIAAEVARGLGFEVEVMPAFWREGGAYNPRAGFERNVRMLERNPDLVLAFWDRKSTGTAHTLREAQARNIPIEIVTPFGFPSGVDPHRRWGQRALPGL